MDTENGASSPYLIPIARYVGLVFTVEFMAYPESSELSAEAFTMKKTANSRVPNINASARVVAVALFPMRFAWRDTEALAVAVDNDIFTSDHYVSTVIAFNAYSSTVISAARDQQIMHMRCVGAVVKLFAAGQVVDALKRA